MRRAKRFLSALAVGLVGGSLLTGASARGEASRQLPAGPALPDDPLLREMVASALETRPELVQSRSQIFAEKERVPQSRVLPDPTLSLGIQNDGFGGIQIGRMESSWLYIVASQTLPWPGKRGLRGDIVGLDVRSAEADLRRTLLTLAADVERAYLDLLLVRDQLGLLAKSESLWKQSEAMARARYETGETAQSDLLRAQLERNRLSQRRWALQAEEERRITVLNRLRGRSAGEPIATVRTLADLPDPVLFDVNQAIANSVSESPEMKKAQLAFEQTERRADLARRERWPDVTVSAGVMPRWGAFETMWQAGVAFNIPVWSAARQARVIAENRARGQAVRGGSDALRQLLEQRVRERLATLYGLVEANRLYRSGLLVESEATVSSTLVQYRVGRASFASVLETLSGHLADLNGFLESVAAAQRIAIAEREISLDGPGGSTGGTMGASPMPGTGATTTLSPSSRVSAQQQGPEGGGSVMSRM